MRIGLVLPLFAVLAAAPIAAHADDLFTLTNGTNTFTFSLPASPTPSATGSACDPNYTESFCVLNLPIDLNGTITDESVNFYLSTDFGGMLIYSTSGNIVNQYGDQLFTGSLSDPTFVPGNYSLADGGSAPDTGPYNLTISTTPEPSSLFLLGTGLLGLASAARRKLLV